jgi:hypothetical protein
VFLGTSTKVGFCSFVVPESVRGAVNREDLALSGLLELASSRPLRRFGPLEYCELVGDAIR